MRDTNSWRRDLRRTLTKHRLEIEIHLKFAKFCDIELGLYLLSQLVPGARADSLWVIALQSQSVAMGNGSRAV